MAAKKKSSRSKKKTSSRKRSKSKRVSGSRPRTAAKSRRNSSRSSGDDPGESALPASAHQELSVDLSGYGSESNVVIPADEFVGDILPEFQRNVAQSGGYQTQAAESETLFGHYRPGDQLLGGPGVGKERYVPVWYASHGNRSNEAMISGPTGMSVQEMVAEVIIGSDDRVRVNNTTSYPFSALCSLEIEARTGRTYVGTGWLIDSTTVITAGHCVYLRNEGGWARSIKVFPGRNGDSKPATHNASRLMSVRGWVEDGIPASDYGAIKLGTGTSGTGTIGYGTGTADELRHFNCHVIGYPADKLGQMWGHARRLSAVRTSTLVYDIDTYGGNSGGPILVVVDGQPFSIGIHNYGDLSGNSATRITDRVFDNIESWKS